jgi:hypothetical protein
MVAIYFRNYSVPEIILEEADYCLRSPRNIMKKYFLNLMNGKKKGG